MSSTGQIYDRAAKRRGDKFDQSMTRSLSRMLNDILILEQQWLPNQTFHQFHDLYTELYLHRLWVVSEEHLQRVACQQGTLTLPDTWFRPPLWDWLVLQLLKPDSWNLPCLYSTFHLENPLVLSRFCSILIMTQLHPRDPENRQQNRFSERRFSEKTQLQPVEWESVA